MEANNTTYSKEIKESMIRDFATHVGIQIRLRRTKMKLTLYNVSNMTGITQAQLSKIERGEADMKLSTLAILRSALALDIRIDGL